MHNLFFTQSFLVGTHKINANKLAAAKTDATNILLPHNTFFHQQPVSNSSSVTPSNMISRSCTSQGLEFWFLEGSMSSNPDKEPVGGANVVPNEHNDSVVSNGDFIEGLKIIMEHDFCVENGKPSGDAVRVCNLRRDGLNTSNVLPSMVVQIVEAIKQVSARLSDAFVPASFILYSLFSTQLQKNHHIAFKAFETAMQKSWKKCSDSDKMAGSGVAQSAKKSWSAVMPMLYNASSKSLGIMCKGVS